MYSPGKYDLQEENWRVSFLQYDRMTWSPVTETYDLSATSIVDDLRFVASSIHEASSFVFVAGGLYLFAC